MCSFFQQCNHHRVFYLLLWKVGWIMRKNNSATEIIVPITQFKIQSHWSCVLAACRKSFIEICFSLFCQQKHTGYSFTRPMLSQKKAVFRPNRALQRVATGFCGSGGGYWDCVDLSWMWPLWNNQKITLLCWLTSFFDTNAPSPSFTPYVAWAILSLSLSNNRKQPKCKFFVLL